MADVIDSARMETIIARGFYNKKQIATCQGSMDLLMPT
jgi:hypothetical protein